MTGTIEAFSQDLVRRITGLSRRQLEYWDELGLISPSVAAHDVSGLPRLYSFKDLLMLKVASEMRQQRVRPGEMKSAIEELKRRGIADPLLTLRIVAEPEEGEGKTLTGAPLQTTGPIRRHTRRLRHGRAYWIDPRSGAAMSWRSVSQQAEVFDATLKDLRSGLLTTIRELMSRPEGEVETVRGVQGSKPVIAGTRVPTRKVTDLLADGWSPDEVVTALPHLTLRDVEAAAQYEQEQKRRRSA